MNPILQNIAHSTINDLSKKKKVFAPHFTKYNTVNKIKYFETPLNNHDENKNFYHDNEIEFIEKYFGKTIVIVGKKIIGVYDTYIDAFNGICDDYSLKHSFIKTCLPS